MIILFGGLLLVGLTLMIYALYCVFFSKHKDAVAEKKSSKISLPADLRPKKEDLSRVNSLESELEKTKLQIPNLETELEATKKREADLKTELSRKEQWTGKGDEQIKKMQEENFALKNKFLEKEREVHKLFSQNVELKKQLEELNLKLQSSGTPEKATADEIELTKRELQRYMNVAKEQAVIIAEFRKKEQIEEWVPKQEYSKLNDEYLKLEKDLTEREERLKKLVEELIQLKDKLKITAQFEEPQQTQPQPPTDQTNLKQP